MKYSLGWGHSVCVRKAFVESMKPFLIFFNHEDVLKMDYTDHSGDPELVEATKAVVERQLGIKYKHMFLTNGATGGLSIALTALKQHGHNEVITNVAPFFRMYPDLIKNSGLDHIQSKEFDKHLPSVTLVDSPANPTGKIYTGDPTLSCIVSQPHRAIFDSVYYTKTYLAKSGLIVPKHDINIGSYSKMTGINGLRIGFVATNDDILANTIKNVVASEYCGLSHPQYTIMNDLVKNVDWDLFEIKSKANLDINREEFTKLEKYFAGYKVTDSGMFWYAPMDSACKRLLDGAGVSYFPGSQLGDTDEFARFNLGQDVELVREAVKAVLAEDKI